MATTIDLQRILDSCSWADALAVVDLNNMAILHALGAVPEPPLRDILGAATADMMAGSNVRLILEEFAKRREAAPTSQRRAAVGIEEVLWRTGERWHWAGRINAYAGQYVLVLSGAKPTIGMAVAQSQAAVRRLDGAQII